jgi:hypothetical protein
LRADKHVELADRLSQVAKDNPDHADQCAKVAAAFRSMAEAQGGGSQPSQASKDVRKL